ncbi:glycerol-3-phosphate responsive antiterminator [Schaalia vaccimaxillae]|uniref:glycerol-3-phosphate responsive antiterminator n=1 Tax=Schaalia vaccimaxillae TaxID=183916 RepID=UPI0003B4BA7B|nr:glycerol-3-phosphate responsive antiterminator [Schaalia vaccimaxillae]
MEKSTEQLLSLLKSYPLILGIDSEDSLEAALLHEAPVVLTLGGTVGGIAEDVARLKLAGKYVIVDIDLIDGLASRPSAVDFLMRQNGFDSVLSTKSTLLKYASNFNVTTIHRMFVVDSAAFRSTEGQWQNSGADLINIQPGWPKVIDWIRGRNIGPIIASGLVCDWKSVTGCLDAGAVGFCTTDKEIWAGASAFWKR